MIFTDILYGKIEIPEWLEPFLTIPEFVRLRGVRLSNIDSIDLKDFNTPTRWEHCIGAAFLALRFSNLKNLSKTDKIHLTLASLLHDIGTPPYAHTVEYILNNFDHEMESYNLIIGDGEDFSFESVSGGFFKQFTRLKKNTRLNIDAEKIAEIIIGEGKYGFLLNGSIDIDNIDNLVRAAFYSGIDVNRQVPFELIKWLSNFNSAPTDLTSSENITVKQWLTYRNELYRKFYESKNDLGRQAFLQHLIRRSHNIGLPTKPILYNTDYNLLNTIEQFEGKPFQFEGKSHKTKISTLVNKFRLLENVTLLTKIPIYNEEELRILSNPLFANWLELKLFNDSFEPFVLVNKKRFDDKSNLFNDVVGEICIYILESTSIWRELLPTWLKEKLNTNISRDKLLDEINTILKSFINESLNTKPWHSLDNVIIEDIKSNLNHEKDWSFKTDRNKSIHIYPATFVRTIPNRLISSLGLKGELIIDPFGGTGQTAEEAVRLGCRAIISDINSIAYLTSKVKFTFLTKNIRDEIRNISGNDIKTIQNYDIPNFEKIQKWHHPDTLIELSRINQYINEEQNLKKQNFLKVCFSDILISSTERRGKGHSYFADNTPLPSDMEYPSYQNSLDLFITKIHKNIDTLENMYSSMERKRRTPKDELNRVKVMKMDARIISPEIYGISEKEAAAIITSPPYLCMVDYTLGQRLSYNWLFPEDLENDFTLEIGSRRKRTNPQRIYTNYKNDIKQFVNNAIRLIRKNGYLVTIIGEPTAKSFYKYEILNEINEYIIEKGFEKIWEIDRPISWHRNHSISSLDQERISIYVLTI